MRQAPALPLPALLPALLAACAAVPGTGPTARAILEGPALRPAETAAPERPAAPYALVTLDAALAERVSRAFAATAATAALPDFPADAPPPRPVLGIGDAVEIAILSRSETGFPDFAQAAVTPFAVTTLPLQEVAADGRLQVPPLGRVEAAGLPPETLETRLRERLAAVLVEPSVVLRVARRASARAAVLGEVARPGSFALDRPGLRLVDLLAEAGGPLRPAADLVLALDRGGRTARAPLERVLAGPPLDIRVWPGDVIRVEPARRRFVVLGGAGQNGEFEFARPDLSLAAALGQARGLVDRQADRSAVFLYRPAPAALLRALGVPAEDPPGGAPVPAIWRLDLTDPAALFAARALRMEDGDVLYIPDAPLAEADKVLAVLNRLVPEPVDIAPFANPFR